MYHGGGLELMREFFKDYNIISFPAGNTGAQMGGWFRKEIKTVADLKGLKMRIGGIGGQVLEKLGVVPQQIPGGDIYPALEKGTIDAAEWVGPYDDEKLGFYKVAKYYYYPGWWEGGPSSTLFVNIKAWDDAAEGIPGDPRGGLLRGATSTCWPSTTRSIPPALKRLVASGVKLRRSRTTSWPPATRPRKEVYDEIAAKNAKFKKVYEPWKKFRDDAGRSGSASPRTASTTS